MPSKGSEYQISNRLRLQEGLLSIEAFEHNAVIAPTGLTEQVYGIQETATILTRLGFRVPTIRSDDLVPHIT